MRRALLLIALGAVIGQIVSCVACGRAGAADGWLSPDSGSGGGWSGIASAYDENTGTYAEVTISAKTWSDYLALSVSNDIVSTKVRVWSTRNAIEVTTIEVGVYYGDDWHVIYSGSFTVGAYVEYGIGSQQIVSGMRVRYYNNHASSVRKAYVWEADFYGHWADPGNLSIDPEYDLNYVGVNYSLTATVVDAEEVPLPGINVTWSVVDDKGYIITCENVTGDDGEAVAVVNSDGAGNSSFLCEVVEDSAVNGTAVGEWVGECGGIGDPAQLAVFPEYAICLVGVNHSVQAMIYDDSGCLIPNYGVNWSIAGVGDFVAYDVETNDDGVATAVIVSGIEGNTLAECYVPGTAFTYDFEVDWSLEIGGIGMPLWYIFLLIFAVAGSWFAKSYMANILSACTAAYGFSLVDQYFPDTTSEGHVIFVVILILIMVFNVFQIVTRCEHA